MNHHKDKPVTRMCNHPELYPAAWGQTKPEPAYMIGCIHNASCPVCGFGWGVHPHDFNCPDRLTQGNDMAKLNPKADTAPVESAPSPSQEPDTLDSILEGVFEHDDDDHNTCDSNYFDCSCGKKKVYWGNMHTHKDQTIKWLPCTCSAKQEKAKLVAALETMMLERLVSELQELNHFYPGEPSTAQTVSDKSIKRLNELRAALRALVGGSHE